VIAATQETLLDPAQVEQAVAQSPQHACITGTGGLLVMRPLLLHASSPAAHPTHRRVIHLEFGPSQLPHGVAWAMACDPAAM
jgi:hypothetical protein